MWRFLYLLMPYLDHFLRNRRIPGVCPATMVVGRKGRVASSAEFSTDVAAIAVGMPVIRLSRSREPNSLSRADVAFCCCRLPPQSPPSMEKFSAYRVRLTFSYLHGILKCCLGPRDRHSGPFTVLYSRCQLTSRFVFQPFLTPVPPLSNDVLAKALLPFRYLLGVARTLLVLGLALIYLVLVQGICLVFVRSSHPPASLLADFTTVPYTTNISTIPPYIYIYSWTHGSFHSWSVLGPSRAVQ